MKHDAKTDYTNAQETYKNINSVLQKKMLIKLHLEAWKSQSILIEPPELQDIVYRTDICVKLMQGILKKSFMSKFFYLAQL